MHICLGDFCLRVLLAAERSRIAASLDIFLICILLYFDCRMTEMHFANPHEKASKMHRWTYHFEIFNLLGVPSVSGFY